MDDRVPVRVAVDSFCDLVSVATFAVLVAVAKRKTKYEGKKNHKISTNCYTIDENIWEKEEIRLTTGA